MNDTPKRSMPKGGKKGGKRFPQINLEGAVAYAKKLVSKTHTGVQPAQILLPGVFGSAGAQGEVRASAMKQYGLMLGDSKGYGASPLAKSIASAPPDELHTLLQSAVLQPEIFKSLYETFKGDSVSPAKIRQQGANFDVHPDNLDKCTTLFIESICFAGLGTMSGENVIIGTVPHDNGLQTAPVVQQPESPPEGDGDKSGKLETTGDGGTKISNPQTDSSVLKDTTNSTPSARAVIHVNIALDSSLDTEKLAKQLELLRKFGAL